LIDVLFDAAASEHLPAIIVFPWIRSEEQLLEQLECLGSGDRWKISRGWGLSRNTGFAPATGS
jgi:hypothetical protein